MNIVQVFGDSEIRFVKHPKGAFDFGIVASDLAAILEHTDAAMMAKGIDDDWKGQIRIKTRGGEQLLTVIWEPGIRQLLARSRKQKAKEVAMELGLSDLLIPSKEAETIGIIKNAFAHLSPVEQFFVLGFRLDLYFPRHLIAIECDEKHHISVNQKKKDVARQDAITKVLGCQWVRYSPEDKNFCIGKVINEIMQKIY